MNVPAVPRLVGRLGLAAILLVAGVAHFVAVFPGNVWQAINDSDSFGLDTDRARLLRLPFQPLLVALALWRSGPPAPGRSGGAMSGARRDVQVTPWLLASRSCELSAGGPLRP